MGLALGPTDRRLDFLECAEAGGAATASVPSDVFKAAFLVTGSAGLPGLGVPLGDGAVELATEGFADEDGGPRAQAEVTAGFEVCVGWDDAGGLGVEVDLLIDFCFLVDL